MAQESMHGVDTRLFTGRAVQSIGPSSPCDVRATTVSMTVGTYPYFYTQTFPALRIYYQGSDSEDSAEAWTFGADHTSAIFQWNMTLGQQVRHGGYNGTYVMLYDAQAGYNGVYLVWNCRQTDSTNGRKYFTVVQGDYGPWSTLGFKQLPDNTWLSPAYGKSNARFAKVGQSWRTQVDHKYTVATEVTIENVAFIPWNMGSGMTMSCSAGGIRKLVVAAPAMQGLDYANHFIIPGVTWTISGQTGWNSDGDFGYDILDPSNHHVVQVYAGSTNGTVSLYSDMDTSTLCGDSPSIFWNQSTWLDGTIGNYSYANLGSGGTAKVRAIGKWTRSLAANPITELQLM